MNATQIKQESLSRARAGQTMTNYPAIFRGFLALGIPEDAILPRENVFTYNAWKALGRQVRKGEHGVKVVTVRQIVRRVKDEQGNETDKPNSIPWTATVFHVSQTDEAKS